MKQISLLTAALIALGVVSQASASGTFGTTNVVYITGSTAFRANLFNTLTNTLSTPSVFDQGTPVKLLPTGATGGTSQYNISGTINNVGVIISVSLTGSEAGLAALEGNTISYNVPTNILTGAIATPTSGGQASVTLAGTPKPTFLDPATGTASVVAAPDLALADTSQAVSLSASAPALTSYGIVGVIPFTWAKGVDSVADTSWSDLLNVSTAQLTYELTSPQNASLFTGNAADTHKLYLIGRNEGSGTRVNTLAELFASITSPINQYAINNSSYINGVLTAGAVATFGSSSLANNNSTVHLLKVGNDGFDSGGGVKTELNSDVAGFTTLTIGYLGMSDASGLSNPTLATAGGTGQYLTLNGVAENDGNVTRGAYDFWGHEYFYGVPGQQPTDPAGVVAVLLAGSGTTGNPGVYPTQLSGYTTTSSAFEAHALLGGATASAHSSAIDPVQMHADKPSGGDVGYPSQF